MLNKYFFLRVLIKAKEEWEHSGVRLMTGVGGRGGSGQLEE